jgi:phage-related minor tail protein
MAITMNWGAIGLGSVVAFVIGWLIFGLLGAVVLAIIVLLLMGILKVK